MNLIRKAKRLLLALSEAAVPLVQGEVSGMPISCSCLSFLARGTDLNHSPVGFLPFQMSEQKITNPFLAFVVFSKLPTRGGSNLPTGLLLLTVPHSFSKKLPGIRVKGAGFGERMLTGDCLLPPRCTLHCSQPVPETPRSVTSGCKAFDVKEKETHTLQESPSGQKYRHRVKHCC